MPGLFAIVSLGFVLGMRHACDPDHVIAVSTIVARHRSVPAAALIGAVWGVGHTITIFVVGIAIVAFSVVIPPRLDMSMEMAVGVMLIVLGAMNLTGIAHRIFHRFAGDDAHGADHGRGPLHAHEHSHGKVRHSHPHVHLLAGHRASQVLGHFNAVRAFAVGIVHGLAGSAAVALLVMSTIRGPRFAAVYLAVFGLGTIAGMMLISTLLAVPLAAPALRSARLERVLVSGSGLVSLAFGAFIVWTISFGEGLFY